MEDTNNSKSVDLLSNKIDRIEDKMDTNFDKMDVRLESIDKNLALHMYRTELNEQSIAILKTYIDQETVKITTKIEPIQTHVTSVITVVKFLAGALGILATIAGIYAVFLN